MSATTPVSPLQAGSPEVPDQPASAGDLAAAGGDAGIEGTVGAARAVPGVASGVAVARGRSSGIVTFAQLEAAWRERHDEDDDEGHNGRGRDLSGLALIGAAYRLADRAHAGQRRKSGEAYITHPLAAALEACELGMDAPTVAAALCHDVIEDCGVTAAQVASEVSAEVATLVEGVTKVDRLRLEAVDDGQAASMRKMFVAVAQDVRVLIVKLCDRLHNMRTLDALDPDKARKVAAETMAVHAPLAHRLGLHEVKWQLEDLAFATLHPERYEELARMLEARAGDRATRVAQLCSELSAALAEAGLEAQVHGRAKHLYSVYTKMVVGERDLDQIFDLVGLRVICASESDCYTALGVVHRQWTPVAGRVKDFIATPTYALYQSLHTTVVPTAGGTVEIQIRTQEMHERAEYGVAAHYRYKDAHGRHRGGERRGGEHQRLEQEARRSDWVGEVAGIDHTDPTAYLDALARELAGDEVYVFTPKGKVIALPAGATAIDFAYAVHTEIGHQAVGARVDGRLVRLSAPVRSGQTLEIVTGRARSGPRREWLGVAVTHRARAKIRAWHNARQRAGDLETGHSALWRSLEAAGIHPGPGTDAAVAAAARDLHLADVESLYEAIGAGRVTVKSAGAKVRAHHGELPLAVEDLVSGSGDKVLRQGVAAVHVGGLDDVLVTMARCCSAVAGDEIVGFVTAGRGVSVHRVECPNVTRLSGARMVEVEWSGGRGGTVAVIIEALDRVRLLADVSAALSAQRVNIRSCRTLTGRDRVARLRFEFDLADATHLEDILRTLRGLDGVYEARRSIG